MAYTESAMSKLNKDNLIHTALDMQKIKTLFCPILRKLSELRKNYNKLETDFKAI